MALPDAAGEYYRKQQRVTLSTVALARRLWSRLGAGDFDAIWRALGPQMLVMLAAGQQAAVANALTYVPTVLDELDIDSTPVAEIAAGALVGQASDGRELRSLLYQPIVQTRTALGQGLALDDALTVGGSALDRIVATQVVDAGRSAESLGGFVRPAVTGYFRALSLPSCDRCAVLAGRFYRWNEGFKRHPLCDCRHVPANESFAGDLATDTRGAIEAGLVTGLSKADRRAIVEDGADPSKVINAKREGQLATAQVFGQRMKVTLEGTSRRAGNRVEFATINGRRVAVRPRPESIYQIARDRAHALELLRKYGYVL